MNIFITGGTGFIGRPLLQQLSKQPHQLFVLVRSLERFQHIMKQIDLLEGRNITPVIGDLAQHKLGLQEDSYQHVLTADVIIHAGGPMNIELTEEEAEQAFHRPAEEIVHIAKAIHGAKGLKQFIHVVGFMSPFNEQTTELESSTLLKKMPPYERMKFQADTYIRKSLAVLKIPLSTINPSVVIGDSLSGATEQIGGLSILVDAVRRNLMPVVPGGRDYWLPMVHVDHVAAFMLNLVNSTDIKSDTYYLLDRKQDSLSIQVLLGMIAKELRVRAPMGSIPIPLLKVILGLGAGKLLGIPKESMGFLVQTAFSTESKAKIEKNNNQPTSVVRSILPAVITDLDFRLSHSALQHEMGFSQRKRSNLISLERLTHRQETKGTPIIFLHGTFSGANCFLPAAKLMTEANISLIDLPGFGRTPYHNNPSVIDGYVEALTDMIVNLNTPVVLVGHSFGGLLAAKVMEKIKPNIHQLLLLQPVLHPIAPLYRRSFLTKRILKHVTRSHIRKNMIQSGDFTTKESKLEHYIDYVVHDLKSPRVRTTTAEVMSALTRTESFTLQPQYWDREKVKILWGERDKKHYIPKSFEHIPNTIIPFGHQFPIAEPEMTAEWIQQALKI